MPVMSPIGSSFLGLLRSLTGDTKTFLRQEIQLAKTEISEKISRLGKNASSLAIGGFVAYAGLIVFLIALGYLGAFLLERADLEPLLASFIAFGGIGLLVILIGTIMLLKGLKAISREGFAPERTIQTLQDLKGGQDEYASYAAYEQHKQEEEHKPSSGEMQARVEATEARMGDTLEELGRRLSPSRINANVKAKIQSKPYQTGLIAMVAGVLSGVLLRRKFRHA